MSETLNQTMRRQLVAGAGILLPGAANALAARVIEAAGFKMMMLSGAAVAMYSVMRPCMSLART